MGLPYRWRGFRKVRGELAEIAPKDDTKELRRDFSQSGQSLVHTRPQAFGRGVVGRESDVAVVVLDQCDVHPV